MTPSSNSALEALSHQKIAERQALLAFDPNAAIPASDETVLTATFDKFRNQLQFSTQANIF